MILDAELPLDCEMPVLGRPRNTPFKSALFTASKDARLNSVLEWDELVMLSLASLLTMMSGKATTSASLACAAVNTLTLQNMIERLFRQDSLLESVFC